MSGPDAVGAEQAQALALIHAAAFPPAERWSETVIGLQLAAPGGFAFADSRGGMLLGRVVAEDAEVLTLCVVPDQRRRGLGAALLAAALGHAARSGANAMFLEVSVRNVVAIRLYQRIGFLVVGQRRRYYADGTDALVMRVAIDPAAGRDAAGPPVARKH